MARTKFKDAARQERYDWARRNHSLLVREQSGQGNAYRRGYDNPEAKWNRSWSSYAVWCAGRDVRREINALPDYSAPKA
jgi:hypothetical protein